MQQLISDLQKAEERCVLLEAEVREEVAEEMAQVRGQLGQRAAGRAPWPKSVEMAKAGLSCCALLLPSPYVLLCL